MDRNFFLVSLFTFFTSVSIFSQSAQSAQYYIHDANKPNPMFGSARELKGKTHIINCFVSDDKRGWNKKDKALEIAMEMEGLGWLQYHKSDWYIDTIEFTTSTIGMEEDIKLGKIEQTQDITKPKSVTVPIVLNAAGYTDILGFYDSVKNATKADNILLLIFVKKASRSYALPAYTNLKSNERFLEGSVIFKEGFLEFQQVLLL